MNLFGLDPDLTTVTPLQCHLDGLDESIGLRHCTWIINSASGTRFVVVVYSNTIRLVSPREVVPLLIQRSPGINIYNIGTFTPMLHQVLLSQCREGPGPSAGPNET